METKHSLGTRGVCALSGDQREAKHTGFNEAKIEVEKGCLCGAGD